MYAFFGTRRKLIWALLGILAAVSVVTGGLHGRDVVSGRNAALLIFSWSLISFGIIASTMLRSDPGYVSRIPNLPLPEMRRAFLFMAGSAVIATLFFGLMPQDRWPFSAFGQFVCSATALLVLSDLIALLRLPRNPGSDGR